MSLLKLPIGKQNRLAKKAKMTLTEWRAAQKASQTTPAAPDMAFGEAAEMSFTNAGPDAPDAAE